MEEIPSPAIEKTLIERQPRRVWHVEEKLFAWLLLPFGFLFWCVFPMSRKPLGAVLLLGALYVCSGILLRKAPAPRTALQKLVLLAAVFAALGAVSWSNAFLSFFCVVYLLIAYAYLVYARGGNCAGNGWNDGIGRDLFSSLVIFPFSSLGALFGALKPKEGSSAAKSALKILLGLMIAVLPTMLVISLLSYDSGFYRILSGLFSLNGEKLTENLLRLLFGIPVALYVFALYASSLSGRAARAQQSERSKPVPLLTALFAALPLLVVYGIFFVSQWRYYTGAFTGTLPVGLSYADYARDGFFELCTVACVNYVVVLCLNGLVRDEHPWVLRTLCLLYALFTLVLVATAVAKLLLYIRVYDLTPDRVYAAWFMLLLSFLFVIQLLRAFSVRIAALPLSFAVTTALFLLLVLSGPNRWIAAYNVNSYLTGRTESVDLCTLEDLGDDAVGPMLRLEAAMREKNGGVRPKVEADRWVDYDYNSYERLLLILEEKAREERPFFSKTVSGVWASKALECAHFGPAAEEG